MLAVFAPQSNSTGARFAPAGGTNSGTIAVTLGSFVVSIAAADLETGGMSVTLGSFVSAITAAVGITGTAASSLGSFVVDIEAADPDTGGMALTLGAFTTDIEASSTTTGSMASILGSFTVSIAASDPETGSMPLTLGAFTTDMEAGVDITGMAASALGSFVVDIEAGQPGASFMRIVLGSFVHATTATSVVAGEAGSFLSPFSVDIEASTTTDPGESDGTMALQLGAFRVAITAVTDEATTFPTLSEIIPAILNSLVDSRVWEYTTPDDLPRGVNNQILPFILWHRVGGQDAEYVEQSPPPSHRHARVQIQSCAPGSITAEKLCEAVMKAMLASTYTVGVYGSPVGAYDNPRKLRAPWQQFSIWFRQSQS